MKAIRYLTYLFYSYYSNGARRNVAYLSSVLAITLLAYIHILIFASLLNIENSIPLRMEESKGSRYIKLILFISPIFFIFYFGVKEKYLEDLKKKMAYQHDREFNHRVLMFIYFFLSFSALMAIAITRKV